MGWAEPPTKEQLEILRDLFPTQTIAVIHHRGFPRDHFFIEIG